MNLQCSNRGCTYVSKDEGGWSMKWNEFNSIERKLKSESYSLPFPSYIIILSVFIAVDVDGF